MKQNGETRNCCCSVLQSCLTLWPHGLCLTVPHCLPEFTQVHVHWVSDVSNLLILCCLLLLLTSIFPSIRVFSNKSALCIRWLKYWSFSFNISPSNEYSVLISFRTVWFDLLAVKGTLKSLLSTMVQNSASILQHSAFFTVQFMYGPTIHVYWKNHSFEYKDLSQQNDASAF